MKNIYLLLMIGIMVSFFACGLDDPLEEDCDQIFLLETDVMSATANGANKITLTATLDEDIKPNVKVTFRTEYGSFENSNGMQELEVTSTGKIATARLLVTNIPNELFNVSAQVEDNCQQSAQLSTTSALPHFIDFETDKLEIKADRTEEAALTVNLFRNPSEGTVSDGVKIMFDAVGSNADVEPDLMPDFAFSENGTATINLRSASDSTGVVTVTATVDGADGMSISESVEVEFVQ